MNLLEYKSPKQLIVGIIGLGYVGFPLAVHFSRHYKTIGFDTNSERITELCSGNDLTGELSSEAMKEVSNIKLTIEESDLREVNCFIVTVPTPVDSFNRPDLSFLEKATNTVAQNLSSGDLVIYESTVYPGCTEEFCIPILEKNSGLLLNHDFFVGYSPERINPGDVSMPLSSITKVVSGSTDGVANFLETFYGQIISAGTYRASNIKTAEASKIVENTQRDLNIALMNELAVLFDKLDLKIYEVLAAARTKWNFLDFKPGLVGGHCISVDPYYLLHKAQEVDFYPEVIWAGRRANNSVVPYIFEKSIRLLNKKNTLKQNSNILILGFSFKENCPDVRNTRVYDLYMYFSNAGFDVDVFDPTVNKEDVMTEYSIEILDSLTGPKKYGLIIVAVAHKMIKNFGFKNIKSLGSTNCVIFDIKDVFIEEQIDASM